MHHAAEITGPEGRITDMLNTLVRAGGVDVEGGPTVAERIQALFDNEKLEGEAKQQRRKLLSDIKLAKYIRPVTLIALMTMFMVTMVMDSLDNLPFNVKDSYVSLLEILMLTSFGAYFAGRTIEKSRK